MRYTALCLLGWGMREKDVRYLCAVSDYYLALAVVKLRCEGIRKCLVWVSVTINLGILALFKYYDFFLDSFAQMCRSWGWEVSPPTLRLVGSKVIQPAPGTNTSAQAWVEPASAEPTRSWLGSCR